MNMLGVFRSINRYFPSLVMCPAPVQQSRPAALHVWCDWMLAIYILFRPTFNEINDTALRFFCVWPLCVYFALLKSNN